MTILEVMLATVFAGAVLCLVGGILIHLNHEYAEKRFARMEFVIRNNTKKMLIEYTDDLLKKTMDMSIEMTKKMMGETDD